MSRKARNRMTRETIPEGFSAPMAFVDLLPVVFFGLSAVKAGNLFHSGLFVAGGGSLPALGRCEGGMEAHRGRLPKEHLADVCADAHPDAGRLFDDVRGTDRRPRRAERGSDACKAERFSGMSFLPCGRAWDDFDARFRVPDGFERPEGELDGADRQQPCADLLFHRADAGLTLCIERKKRAACGRLLLHQAMKKNECERCFNEYRK